MYVVDGKTNEPICIPFTSTVNTVGVLMLVATRERLDVLVSTVPIGKLVPLKVKPNSVGLELNPFELKAASVVQLNVTVSARATP